MDAYNHLSLPTARILGIESSCDETAAAVIENGRVLLSSVVASQVDLHAKYGGVFPEVASRQHIRTIYAVVDQALQQAHMKPGRPGCHRGDPRARAGGVAGGGDEHGQRAGAGQPTCPWWGSITWKGISTRPGCIPRMLPSPPPEPHFPLLALLVSGGHSELNLMTDHLTYQRLGSTLDDAAGEAFDKVARLLGLSYPGGPSIQKAAENGNPQAFHFPRARLEGTWNFSFSGLKTAVLRTVRELEENHRPIPVEDLAASFQAAVVDVLVSKTLAAAQPGI